ncbi:putative phenylacetate-coenzyme A ligase [Candidatus Promineifilum breve]|uniref:Phenylacetate-coenzyme A ligase n=1 Tax=Candidatus Promineifilum breve TaxID=1806508 RepID=A0A170PHK1_9CHLR|nr:AMP-binding protein [Candidatus Promineifilum breve]CUS04357.2 putative phenylacetate-coenzyme A ligase [Candidatus Promineifilum breve]
MDERTLHDIIQHAYANSPAFRARLDGAGVRPEDVKSVADLTAVPVLTKDEAIALQQAEPPFGGMLAAPLSAVSHIFFSPGPLYEPGPEEDDAAWDTAVKMLREVGFGAGEIILNSLSYHLVPAGYLFDGAFTRLGATVIPAGTGPTELQLQMAATLGATGYVGTPSFLLSLMQKAEEKGVGLQLHRAVVTAEPLPPALRQTLTRQYGLGVINTYATAELGVLAVNTGEGMAMRLLPEPLIQVVNPDSGQPVGPGETGEVVVTNTNRLYPLIRFGTGDLAMNVDPRPGESAQEERAIILVGRRGEAVKVRGMFLHPNQLRFAAAQVPGVRAMQAIITRPDGGRDHLALRVDAPLPEGEGEGEGLRAAIAEGLKGAVQGVCRVKVDEVGFGEVGSDMPPVVDEREWQ